MHQGSTICSLLTGSARVKAAQAHEVHVNVLVGRWRSMPRLQEGCMSCSLVANHNALQKPVSFVVQVLTLHQLIVPLIPIELQVLHRTRMRYAALVGNHYFLAFPVLLLRLVNVSI